MEKMKKEKGPFRQKISELWHTQRGKAALKLVMWGLFFILLLLTISIMNLFSKPNNNIKKPDEIIPEKTFLSLEEIMDSFDNMNYKYNHSVLDLITNEVTTYNGERKENIDTGYKESKLGIIKYKIVDQQIYQVLVDSEILNHSIFSEEDFTYLNLSNITTIIEKKEKTESINGSFKNYEYSFDDKKILIKTTHKNLSSIKITTSVKEYNLTFQEI